MVNRTYISILLLTVFAGCSTSPSQPGQREQLHSDVQEAIGDFQRHDPTLRTYFERSAGYAVFPKVLKGAFGLGGAYGQAWYLKKAVCFWATAI